ncbi:hypothetical protein RUND412_000703 [Rhizina undulata]
MSLEPPSRIPSPPSSGRSSPAPVRRRNDDGLAPSCPTQIIIKREPKYKRFSANIDRALSLFESATLQEWADYISFLGRLLKALQSHPSLPLIPSKAIISKRLAQCLNPRLPSGVHQKTIEVYSYIFQLIGRDGLANDLTLWTPGLTPVLSYASLTLKPHYLTLLEKFYLPLSTSLRPALKSLILALLPGIDEEGGEYFDRTLALMDSIRKGVGDDAYFWQCFLLATITSPGRRQGALAFLARRLPKLDNRTSPASDETEAEIQKNAREAEALIHPEPGLLVRAFCAGLADEQLLVQRGFLDLLVVHLPLSSKILQESVRKPDLEILVTSAAGVVLRRDMSLNRRLWAWFLGPEEHGQNIPGYFEKYGLESIVGGLRKMLDPPPEATAAERAKPYRICLSLMDRWGVGSAVVPHLFLPAIESVREFEKNASNKGIYSEVLKSASMFFDGVEAGLIWGQVLERILKAFSGVGDGEDVLESVSFLLRTFNVKEEEMVQVHAPLVVVAVLLCLTDEKTDERRNLWKKGFELVEELWTLIPVRTFKGIAASTPGNETSGMDGKEILTKIQSFYGKNQAWTTGATASISPLSMRDIAELVPSESARSIKRILQVSGRGQDISARCKFLVNILRKAPKLPIWTESKELLDSFIKALTADNVSFAVSQGAANVISAMYSVGYLSSQEIDLLILPIVRIIWANLSPDTPKFHVEAIKTLWNLQGTLGDRRIEAAIATVMTKDDVGGTYAVRKAEQGRKFGVLWTHSIAYCAPVGTSVGGGFEMVLTRPLFLFLDSLVDDRVEMQGLALEWIENLGSANRLFNIFVSKFLGLDFLKEAGPRDSSGMPVKRHVFEEDDDLEVATYYFQTLANVLEYSMKFSWDFLRNEFVAGSDEARAKCLSEQGYGSEDLKLQIFFVKAVMRAIDGDEKNPTHGFNRLSRLHIAALSVLRNILLNPHSISYSKPLADLELAKPLADLELAKPLADLELENILTARLISILDRPDPYVQISLLETLFTALELSLMRPTSHLGYMRQLSRDTTSIKAGGAGRNEVQEKANPPPPAAAPQPLITCLIKGLSSPNSRPVLDNWVQFLTNCLPLLKDVIFQILLPLVNCLCQQITNTFEKLKRVFHEGEESAGNENVISPESTLVALLNGLEHILAAAHDNLITEELKAAGPKSPDAPTGSFFGSMVSGVFAVESPQNRSAAANNRLTVLLCFQDTVRICYSIWSWGDIHSSGKESLDVGSRESWSYTSLRMRNRAKRILEHMFAAETLECLETLIELWPARPAANLEKVAEDKKAASIFKLINYLDGSKPKHTIPAIFNAIYSRTNPSALDPARKSTLTAELSDQDVVVFLVEYARSLEDDAMDEIWADCMVFLKDVLTNPFPHRQTLPSLLAFTAVLGKKVDNTNFGEQKKMRKELGDLFLRLLTAAFTVRPIGSSTLEPVRLSGSMNDRESDTENKVDKSIRTKSGPDDIVTILVGIVPELRKVLVDSDRVISASVTISTSLIGPSFRSKAFPQNITPSTLELLYQLTRLPNNQKSWKKELSDAFLDPKFFASPVSLVKSHWVPLARQYLLSDRERMQDLLSRVTPPTTAGVLFGVGATSARQEADRKTQLNLRRIAFMIFAAEQDSFVVNLGEIETKLVEILSATAITSPSCATRGEVYLVLRVLILRTSPVHLAGFWPLLNTELQAALTSLFPEVYEDLYNDSSILQACKLLDTLLVIAPDEFQLHEWLFVTDTIEAVHPPHDWNPLALVDQVSTGFSSTATPSSKSAYELTHNSATGKRPWLVGANVKEVERSGDIKELLGPFFSNLSIWAYEGTYGMGQPDIKACEEGVWCDLFEEGLEGR